MEQLTFPTLSSKRLILRKPDPGDRREIFNLRSNEQVNQFLDREPAKTMDDADAFLQSIIKRIEKNEAFYWMICLKENPKPIGTICLFNLSADKSIVEMGYELLPFYQRNGVMHEAISVVLYYLFHSTEVNTVTAFPSTGNVGSIKLLKRNGFKEVRDDGVETDLLKFVLTRNDRTQDAGNI
jgi:ribosomal-protein-alanine N-acetyltransferase